MRRASVKRHTRETRIEAEIGLDGTGVYDVKTGIGFLDHMLEQLSRHSLIDLRLRAAGDRKSVVSGKSVSVRVDLGGRRIIKKKTKVDVNAPRIVSNRQQHNK